MLRYSVELRNAGLDARIKAVGPNARLKLYANRQGGKITPKCLAEIALPETWIGKAENGEAKATAPWTGKAVAEGEAKSFAICNAQDVICIDGAIPDNLKLKNPHMAPGQAVIVTACTIKSGNG